MNWHPTAGVIFWQMIVEAYEHGLCLHLSMRGLGYLVYPEGRARKETIVAPDERVWQVSVEFM